MRLKVNAGYGALLLGIVAIIVYCALDVTVGWWGLVFLAPILVVLAIAADTPRR